LVNVGVVPHCDAFDAPKQTCAANSTSWSWDANCSHGMSWQIAGLVFGLLVCAFCLVGRAAAVQVPAWPVDDMISMLQRPCRVRQMSGHPFGFLDKPMQGWCQDQYNSIHMGMDQYLLIPVLGEWTSIYQLFWCSPGVQGFDTLPYETDHFMSHLNVRKIHMKHVWDLLWSHAFLSSGLRSCRARRSTEETCLRRRSWRWIGAKLGTPDEVQICKWDKGWQGSPYFQDMPKWLF
jgi:hypothetical protein